MIYRLYILFFIFSVTFGLVLPVMAQSNKIVSTVSVLDTTTLMTEDSQISLWGIKPYSAGVPLLEVKYRDLLEDKIGVHAVTCFIKEVIDSGYAAQCLNYEEDDLAIFLLKEGVATVDRQVIHASELRETYLLAEKQGRLGKKGLWSDEHEKIVNVSERQSENVLMASFILMAVFVLALGVLIFFVIRSFGQVMDVQKKSMSLAERENMIKDRERSVVAAMISSEISENQSKIEAYLLVYEETLKDLDSSAPKYKTSGDLIQKQPSLSRTVFDGNTHKLDGFGGPLASAIIHYYARIKTTPDYYDVTPDTPLTEVKLVVSDILERARKLEEISKDVLEKIGQYGLLK